MVSDLPLRIAVLTVAGALALAACGGSSTPTAARSGQGTSGASAALKAQTSASRARTTTSAAASAAVGGCRASQLSLSFLGGQSATGHGLLAFRLRNVSSHSCRTIGFPGVKFLDSAGRALPTVATRTTQDFFGRAPEKLLDVAPSQSVSFRIGVMNGTPSGAGCVMAAGVSVIPPGDTNSLRVSIPQGVYECRTVTVTPAQPGTFAYP